MPASINKLPKNVREVIRSEGVPLKKLRIYRGTIALINIDCSTNAKNLK